MKCSCSTIRLSFFIMPALAGLCGLAGCTRPNYKRDADEQVYRIIDEKWRDDFGSRANYAISDVTPSPNDIQIERKIAIPGVLTLPQAVALATAHNREYQTQREALYVQALDLRLTRHEFETQFFGGFSGGYNADRNDEVVGAEAGVGFRRLLATGARISTEVALAWADVLTGNMRGGLASILSATVTQPLLRGSQRAIVLEGLTQAERDTLYQVRSFNRFRKVFVVSIISQYYTVLQRLEDTESARANYTTLAWLLERVEKLAEAGRLPMIELDEVRQATLEAANVYSQAEKEYRHAIDEFKLTLSLSTSSELRLDEGEFEALRAAEMIGPEFSEDQVLEAAQLARLDLANSADAVLDAQRKVAVAADNLRAQANLIGVAGTTSARRADRHTLDWLGEDYGIGLELDLPLDRVPEQNVYRKALITLNQRQREYTEFADTVKLQVRQAHRDLVEASERYRVLSEALELAQRRFNKTFLLVQHSRASSRRVLQAQRDLFEAQNDAAQALVDYKIAILSFYRDTGVLQVRPDGMWQL
ncbi:MAG: TolC family protein [Phycisphaerales bacterium]|nr:MAG: TolC family protein [Phycisphaerales bacterium]